MSEHDETHPEDSGMPPRGYVRFDEDVAAYRPREQPWLVRNGVAILASAIGVVSVSAFVAAVWFLSQP